MNKKFLELADQAGFVLWDDEPWATGLVDWAGASDGELEQYSQLLVQECAEFIQALVDQRVPASEYPKLLVEHFTRVEA